MPADRRTVLRLRVRTSSRGRRANSSLFAKSISDYRNGPGIRLPMRVASHCRPWRDSTNGQRLDGENGLLLTPSVDHLFDRGFIGFEDSGDLIVSPVAHLPSLERMGIETRRGINVGGFTEGQRAYLDFHRNAVLLRAVR
jgi:putative restriction endonuclease